MFRKPDRKIQFYFVTEVLKGRRTPEGISINNKHINNKKLVTTTEDSVTTNDEEQLYKSACGYGSEFLCVLCKHRLIAAGLKCQLYASPPSKIIQLSVPNRILDFLLFYKTVQYQTLSFFSLHLKLWVFLTVRMSVFARFCQISSFWTPSCWRPLLLVLLKDLSQ